MERRKFLLASGSAVLSGATLGVTQQPSFALDFQLSGIPNRNPSNVNSILVQFSKFKLTPRYVDYNEPINVEITASLDNYTETVSKEISIKYKQQITKQDLESELPVVIDQINTSQDVINGEISIKINHPNISETYSQSFSIEDNAFVNGLVSYYPIEKGDGDVIQDGTTDTIGQISGATWDSDTPVGSYSLQFQDSDFVEIPNPIDPTSDNDNFTVSFWAKPKGNGQAPMLEWSTNADPDLHIWQYDSQDDFYLNPLGSSDSFGDSNGEILLDQWSHYTALYDDSDGEFRLYRDGSLVQTSSQPDATSEMSSDVLLIGKRENDTDRRYIGKLDSIRIYNRALSKSEIEGLSSINYNAGNKITESDVPDNDDGGVSRYKLNGNPDDAWGSNNGNDTSTSGYGSGVYGNSKIFDGSSGYIEIPDDSSLGVTNVTISLWVYRNGTKSKEYLFDGRNHEYLIKLDDDTNLPLFSVNSGTDGDSVTLDNPIRDKEWVHLVGTYDGNKVKLHRNGEVKKSSSNVSGDINTSSGVSRIGNYINDGYKFQGKIDDVRIYDRALTETEIKKLFNLGSYYLTNK